MLPDPLPGSLWRCLESGAQARVMCVTERWVVARYKHCDPFLRHLRDWHHEFERAT